MTASPRRKYCRVLSLLILITIALVTTEVWGAVFRTEGRVFIPKGDTLNDDLYMFGGEAILDGLITHDVFVFCQRYQVTGEIGGSLNTFSQSATVRGRLANSANVFAYKLTIDGEIANNLNAFAYGIEMSPGSHIGNDAALMAAKVSLAGAIDGDAHINADRVLISGPINGNLDIRAKEISIAAPAQIGGNIKYKSPNEIQLGEGVTVGGKIDWEKIEDENQQLGAANWQLRLALMLCALLTGAIIILMFRHHTRVTMLQIIEKPLVSLGVGFVTFFVVPFAVLILIVTLIGLPAAILLLFIYAILFYIAKVYVAMAVGRVVICAFRKGIDPKPFWSLLLGLFFLMILFAVPVIGWILYLGVIFFGIGAIILGIRKCQILTESKSTPAALPQ